jgi:nucleoside-diphosphate kinase
MIKPDAVQNFNIGEIITRFEKSGLRVAGAKMLKLTKDEGKQFYVVHRERPFYDDLTDFISSGPILVMVLEGENAIEKNREIMGATNPKDAAPGTIRADFASSIDENAVHGSDSPTTAEEEIFFFFDEDEILAPRGFSVDGKSCSAGPCGCSH